ncbi:MAG TPA: methylated-DNA--[protein]-cysteine S-methyltransferase, partial [Solirubrobacteraceae bacterium]
AGEGGLVRLAFDTHADAALLAARAHRPAPRAAAQLEGARTALGAYFGADAHDAGATVDWAALPDDAEAALAGVAALPYAGARSYHRVGGPRSSRELGRWCGENPVPVVVPCHRVLRGDDPVDYTGGLERKEALIDHERRRAERTPS